MIRFSRRSTLSPPVARHFEFTRFQSQLIVLAYQVLIPVVSQDVTRSQPRSSRNQPTTSQSVRSKVGGA